MCVARGIAVHLHGQWGQTTHSYYFEKNTSGQPVRHVILASRPRVAFKTWANPWFGLLRQQESEGEKILGRREDWKHSPYFHYCAWPPPTTIWIPLFISAAQWNLHSFLPSLLLLPPIIPSSLPALVTHTHTSFSGLFNSASLWLFFTMAINFLWRVIFGLNWAYGLVKADIVLLSVAVVVAAVSGTNRWRGLDLQCFWLVTSLLLSFALCFKVISFCSVMSYI